MSGVATAIVGGSVIGGYSANKAAKESRKGAEAQAAVGRENVALQRDIFEQTREDFAPYREAGEVGLTGYMAALEDPSAYRKSPGYMFRLQEGLKAIGIPEGSNRLSGPQMKAAIQYAQDYATSDYDRYLSRYGSLIDVGRGAQTATAGAGQAFGAGAGRALQNVGMAYQQAGNARASGYMGMANAVNQGIQNYMLYNMMTQNPTPVGSPMAYGG